MDVNRVPGGYEKDRPWTEASQKTVAYYATEARNPGMKAAAQAELDRRKAGGVQEPPSERTQQHQQQREQQRSTAVAKTREQMLEPVSKILHGFRDAEQVTAALMLAQERAHLIAPATSTAALPEGFEIVLSAVLIDVPNETYPVLGKRGLGKTALDRIAQAAAISWNPGYTQRLDDGSDPHYCHFRAVADVLTFDNR